MIFWFGNAKTIIWLQSAMSGILSLSSDLEGEGARAPAFPNKKERVLGAGRQLFFVSSAVWNALLLLVHVGLSTLWRHREKGKALSNQRSRKSVIAEASLADAGRRTHWWITRWTGSFQSYIFGGGTSLLVFIFWCPVVVVLIGIHTR